MRSLKVAVANEAPVMTGTIGEVPVEYPHGREMCFAGEAERVFRIVQRLDRGVDEAGGVACVCILLMDRGCANMLWKNSAQHLGFRS